MKPHMDKALSITMCSLSLLALSATALAEPISPTTEVVGSAVEITDVSVVRDAAVVNSEVQMTQDRGDTRRVPALTDAQAADPYHRSRPQPAQ